MEIDARRARHDLRGRFNALKLCVDALETFNTRDEKLEFLDLIEQAAERTLVALDELDATLSQSGA